MPIESTTNPIPRLLAVLAAALERPTGDTNLRAVFEHHVQEALAIRSVRLREVPARYHARLVTPTRTNEAVVLGVPTADPRAQAVLEATYASGHTVGDREVEALTPLAHLGGLVLEAARARAAQPQPGATDGAAPLLGCTTAMRALRARIERIAVTDFTILIEGESGR